MTWNLELGIEKSNLTIDQIKTIIQTLQNNGFTIPQINLRPHEPSP